MAKSRHEQKPTIIQNPTLEQSVECIREKMPMADPSDNSYRMTGIWRPRPKDPFIYVSFSLDQLKKAYGSDSVFQANIVKNKLEQFPQILIQRLTKIIEEQFIKEARLPIKFLPEKISTDEINNKNVCFIVIDKNMGPKKKGESYYSGLTLSFTSDFTFDFQETGPFFSEYKLILLHHTNGNTLSKSQIHSFLHEGLHAFIEAKHPFPYEEKEEGPFCQLDCQDTSMVYHKHCQTINSRYRQLLLSYPESEITDEEKDGLYKLSKESAANTLQKIDLLAAEDFKKSWELRNSKTKNKGKKTKETFSCLNGECSKKSDPSSQESALQMSSLHKMDSLPSTETMDYPLTETPSSSTASFLSSPFSWLSQKIVSGYDYMLDYARDYATDVAESCPSYFPKNDVTKTTRWRQHQMNYSPLLFSSNQTLSSLSIAPPTSLHLLK